MKKEVVAFLLGAGLLVGCGERDYGGVDSHDEMIEDRTVIERDQAEHDLDSEQAAPSEPAERTGQQGYDQGTEVPQD